MRSGEIVDGSAQRQEVYEVALSLGTVVLRYP